nr:hypothetical protein [Tanacetum cinerariifolium]
IEGIAKVGRGWFLGCEVNLDSSHGGKEGDKLFMLLLVIDKDLINIVLPDVRRYVVVLTGNYYPLKELRSCAQCLVEDEDLIKRSRSTLREEA